MFTIFLTTSFKASHQLTFSGGVGVTEPLHEHDWQVCAAVCAEHLNEDGLVMDFEELKRLVEGILQDFRGRPLETNPLFERRNASAENVARLLYEQLKPQLPDTVRLDYVEVTEAPGCRARFSV